MLYLEYEADEEIIHAYKIQQMLLKDHRFDHEATSLRKAEVQCRDSTLSLIHMLLNYTVAEISGCA
jgi:hypothetical protein